MSLEEQFLTDLEQYPDTVSIVHSYIKLGETMKALKKENYTDVCKEEQELRKSMEGINIEELIERNFDIILNGVIRKKDILSFVNVLSYYYKDCQIIYNNFEKIVSAADKIGNLRDLRDLYIWIVHKPNGKEVFIENIDFILGLEHPEAIIDLIELVKGRNKELDVKIEKALSSHSNGIAKVMLERASEDNQIDNYVDTLEFMIKEILKSENKNYLDITRIAVGNGEFSFVYKIGDKILKVGSPRGEFKMPNHRRILQPLARKAFRNRLGKTMACVEISEEVDTNIEQKDPEELYKLWKELRDEGVIWTDVTWENVGRLKKKNIPSLNGEEMYVEPEAAGFKNKYKGKPLEKGELVILDTDFIFEENSPYLRWFNFGYAKSFEDRYKKENALDKEEEER